MPRQIGPAERGVGLMNDYAALDFGTNSVLLLLAGGADFRIAPVEKKEWCAITRLGEGAAGAARCLQPGPMRRTIEAAAGFLAELGRYSPSGVGVAVATSAVRDAPNRDEFRNACRAAFGWAPLVLSGDQEAEAAFLGATGDQPADRFVITVDVGGGSTELAAGFPGRCLYRCSLALGCVRFGERYGLYDAPVPKAVRAARREVARLAGAAVDELLAVTGGRRRRVVASGGTATTYAAWRQALDPYSRLRVHGFRDRREVLADSAETLLRTPLEQRRGLPGIPSERAPVLPTGLLILDEILAALGIAEFQVSTRGLRYGLVLQLRDGTVNASWRW